MDGLLVTLAALGVWVAVFTVFRRMLAGKPARRRPISSDGHAVSPEQDLTCETKSGHSHPKMSAKDEKDYGKRYIVHNDPENGYVILNGVMRKISDCKDL